MARSWTRAALSAQLGDGAIAHRTPEPMPGILSRAEYWRERAAEARAVADNVVDDGARSAMLQVAAGYDAMAMHKENLDAIAAKKLGLC
jgi:hypothetical protein